jgi:hypothetical protein
MSEMIKPRSQVAGLRQVDLHAEYTFKIWNSTRSLFAHLFNVTNRR